MATAKKEAAKKESKKASAAEVDDVLASKPAKKAAKGDDVLEGKKATKKPAKKEAPAKKEKKAKKADGVSTEDVRAALGKARKLTSYADIATATGADLRQVRRTARAMRDDGEIEIVKEGTVCFVKKA
jgi:hypothetical protein